TLRWLVIVAICINAALLLTCISSFTKRIAGRRQGAWARALGRNACFALARGRGGHVRCFFLNTTLGLALISTQAIMLIHRLQGLINAAHRSLQDGAHRVLLLALAVVIRHSAAFIEENTAPLRGH